MLTAFILGLGMTCVGLLLSLAVQNWYISFGISAVIGAISLVITSILKNFALILRKRAEVRPKEAQKVLRELESMAKILMAFGLPNVVNGIILYFKLYR